MYTETHASQAQAQHKHNVRTVFMVDSIGIMRKCVLPLPASNGDSYFE